MSSLVVNNINKRFGSQTVLDDVSFTLEENTIYALLGRNGAGKSTLLNILTNRLPQNSGSVTYDGASNVNNDAVLQRMYLMSEANLYPPRMRVRGIFALTKQLYGGFDDRLASKLSDRFGLDQNARFNKLSTGYRSILKLIVALAVDVKYVFLDEPTLGLDATHRELFYQVLIESYANRPRTFVISTHLIEEIANMVERVMVLQDGQLTINASAETVLAKSYAISGPEDAVRAYTKETNVIGEDRLGHLFVHYVYGDLVSDREIPDTVTIDHIDLQKLFVYLTNGEGAAHVI